MESKINIKGINITLFSKKDEDFISLTDIARYKNPEAPKDVVKNWMRSKSTIEFLGLWEKINNGFPFTMRSLPHTIRRVSDKGEKLNAFSNSNRSRRK